MKKPLFRWDERYLYSISNINYEALRQEHPEFEWACDLPEVDEDKTKLVAALRDTYKFSYGEIREEVDADSITIGAMM